MIQTILFYFVWGLAGIANSFMDWYGFTESENEAWNKYKSPMEAAPDTLYYRLTGLSFRERFFLSGTILVFLTDKFHFYQFLMTSFVITTIAIRPELNWIMLLALIVEWELTTHIAYIYIQRKNR